MADYRPDCCGGYPACTEECQARGKERLKAVADKKALLDKLYAKYGEWQAEAQRATNDHTRLGWQWKSDGMLYAIRIVEGNDQDKMKGTTNDS